MPTLIGQAIVLTPLQLAIALTVVTAAFEGHGNVRDIREIVRLQLISAPDIWLLQVDQGFRRRGLKVRPASSIVTALLCAHLEAGRVEEFIRLAVAERYSILLSGGTSSGKTTFLNAILNEVPSEERIM